MTKEEELSNVHEWLKQRRDKAFLGILILSILSLPTLLGFPLLFIAAFVHRHMANLLLKRGELIKIDLASAAETAGELWEEETDRMKVGGFSGRQIDDVIASVNTLTQFLGQWLPAVMGNYKFTFDGQEINGNKYMFSSEEIQVDDDGYARVLVDPQHPRLNHWLVCRLPE